MKHNLRLAAAAIMSTSLALFTAPTFATDLPSAPSSSDALAAVRDLGDNRVKQPVPDEESPADIPSAGGEAISLAGTDFAIAVSGTTSAEQYDDVTVIEGSQPGTTTVVQPTKAGVQIMAVLDSPQSNQEQKYDLDMPIGGHAVTQSDGSVLVLDAMDQPAVAIRAPWAEDSDGKVLPTYFTISGSTLTQHVDTREARFPVVADPTVEKAWWGWQIGFTNKQTNKLIKGIVATSTAAGLLSFMSASGIISSPGAIPTGLASGFLALGAAALDVCNFNDKGVAIRVTKVGAGWCWPRG